MPNEHAETATRVKPERGLNTPSLRRPSSEITKTPSAERLRDGKPSSALWDFEDCVLAEQRRCGYIWSDEHKPSDSPIRANQPLCRPGQQDASGVIGSSVIPERGKVASARPEFEHFRRADTPPPVFASPVPALSPQQPPDTTNNASISQRKKRPRTGSRGFSFSKTLLGIRNESRQPEPDAEEGVDERTRRSSQVLFGVSVETTGGSQDSIKQQRPERVTINMADIDQPAVKMALTRSSTMSSIEEWLGLKKSKHDTRFAGLADQQKLPSHQRSMTSHLPRISTFLTETEYRILNKKRNSANSAAPSRDTKADTVSPSEEQHLSPKKERPCFFRSRSRRSQASLPTTSSIGSTDTRDRISDARTPPERSPPISPSKIYAGLLWQPKRRSHEDAARSPVLAKSRRTGTFEEVTAPPSQAQPRSGGWPEFTIPDMHPSRPSLPKYPSSSISPGDDSTIGRNHHLLNSFDQAIAESERSKKGNARRGCAPKSQDYLPTEAQRINTPPEVKLGRGNKFIGHFFDNWRSGSGVQTPAADFAAQEIQTPFPMPQEMPGLPISAPSTPVRVETRDSDWYRVRADQILGYDQSRDLDEMKMFDWDVPDHLPSSPLCPANPKHTSGGTGVCVYHGRAKAKAP